MLRHGHLGPAFVDARRARYKEAIMSSVNSLAREILTKIVYYGPGLSGKTTSLKKVHAAVTPERRGQLVSLATEGDRTLFFDFLPLHLEAIGQLSLRLQLYTVPGQVFYDATRKHVLNGADGVVFVADSQEAAREANVVSMENLTANLAEAGIDLAKFPLVLQYNKRDLPTAMSVAKMRTDLNDKHAPEFETTAERGVGIMPALKEITRLVIHDLNSQRVGKKQQAKRLTAEPRGAPEETLTSQLSAAAQSAPILSDTAGGAAATEGRGISFAALAVTGGTRVAEIEGAIASERFAFAVRMAAEALAELLEGLPSPDQTPAVKASLIGIDGREYLRLCRLAGQPDAVLTERDALFALHVVICAHVRVENV